MWRLVGDVCRHVTTCNPHVSQCGFDMFPHVWYQVPCWNTPTRIALVSMHPQPSRCITHTHTITRAACLPASVEHILGSSILTSHCRLPARTAAVTLHV